MAELFVLQIAGFESLSLRNNKSTSDFVFLQEDFGLNGGCFEFFK